MSYHPVSKKAGAAPTAPGPLDTKVAHSVSPNMSSLGATPEKSDQSEKLIAPSIDFSLLNDHADQSDTAMSDVLPGQDLTASEMPSPWSKGLPVLPSFLDPKTTDEEASDWREWLQRSLRISVRWDEFILADVIQRNGDWLVLDGIEVSALLNECKDLGCPKILFKEFEQYLRVRARRNKFDSAKTWLAQLPKWDSIKRIERFLPDYLGTGSSPYFEAVGRYLWTAMYARLAYPGCKADMVPVIVGKQGIGKTRLLNLIAPEPSYYVDACLTDSAHKLGRKVLGKSLVGWEELAGIKGKVDADRVKTFITNGYDELPSLTKKGMDRYDRRFVIFGTSNRKDFLRDETGSRRFLPFESKWIDLANLEADKLQLWAEAHHIVRERMSLGLSLVDYQDAERLAVVEYDDFMHQARWYGDPLLHRFLSGGKDQFHTADALKAVGVSEAMITHRHRIDMAKTLRQLRYEMRQDRSIVPGKKVKVWRKPMSPGVIQMNFTGAASKP